MNNAATISFFIFYHREIESSSYFGISIQRSMPVGIWRYKIMKYYDKEASENRVEFTKRFPSWKNVSILSFVKRCK